MNTNPATLLAWSALPISVWVGLCPCTAVASAEEAAISDPPASALPHPWRTLTDERLRTPEAADWPTYRRSYDVAAFSPLRQINRSNVKQLRSVWSYSVPDTSNWAMTPVVANGLMFIVENGNRLVALDAVTGTAMWVHERQFPDDIALSQAFNRSRGVTLAGDAIYWGTADAHLLSLDARTGKLLWDTPTGDYHEGEGHDHPALVAAGKVFLGEAGGDRTAHGAFRAFDASTGKLLWTVHTAPRPGESGFDSWPKNFPPLGAAPWGTISYDPALGLVYFGTGQPGPWSSSVRGQGDALYSNSIMAVDVETGAIRWSFQVQPQDDWDRDAAYENILIDVTVDGKPRKALIQSGKIGWGVMLDRQTGEFLRAFKTTDDSVITGWTAAGRPVIDPSTVPHAEDVGTGKTFHICPNNMGARNLNAASVSVSTHLYYVGINNSCMEGRSMPIAFAQGHSFAGAGGAATLVPGRHFVGEFDAFDPGSGRLAWQRIAVSGAAMSASALSTGGGLVFGGTVDREFFALNDKTGALLWRTRLNGDVSGGAISFAVDGRQYVAVTAGGHSIDDVGYAPLTGVRVPSGSGAVWVFALPDARDLQEPLDPRGSVVSITASSGRIDGPQSGARPQARTSGAALFSAAQAALGQSLFHSTCAPCHALADMTGTAFQAKWGSDSLGALFTLISTSMPRNAPASLAKEDYAAIIAFLLRDSGYPAGALQLPADAARITELSITSKH